MITRLKTFASETLTWYRLISFIPFLVALLVVIFVIGRLDRSIHLENLRRIALMASLFGLVFSLMKNPKPVLMTFLSIVSGVIVAFTVTGRFFQGYIAFLETGSSYLIDLFRARYFEWDISPDPSVSQAQWQSLAQSISVLFNRLQDWLISLPEAAYDPVSMNLAWGIIVWLATIWIFWFVLKRNQPLIGFIPPLAIIAGSVPSIESGLVWLGWVLGIGLVMAVVGNYASQDEYWKKNHFTSSHRIWEVVAQYAVFLSAALVLIAAFITSPMLDDLLTDPREKWEKYQERTGGGDSDGNAKEEEAEILAQEVLGETANGWFPNDHLVGSGPELSEIEVFHAKVEERSPGLAPSYYFRAATYETYSTKGWQNIGKETILVDPEEEFEISLTPNEYLILQDVTLMHDYPKGNLMYVVGELAETNVPFYGAYHTKFVNITYRDLFASVTDSDQYRAYSVAPNLGGDDLRGTSQEYPSWVTNKFLQVPESTPDRVYELAIQLTATEPTPYDRALAIESYLRGFEYTLDLDAPPKNRDIVDYFLFDLQKGYCDYYASAMVVMARAAGLPARFVTGYLASTFDSGEAQFVVTADQAHSWAEVYFPEYGWVTFEPTAGQPALERQFQQELMPDDLIFESAFEEQPQDEEAIQIDLLPDNYGLVAIEVGVLAVVGLLVYHRADAWRLSRMDHGRMFSVLYKRLRRKSKRLGVEISPSDTPLEFTGLLTTSLEILGASSVFYPLLISTPQIAARVIEACNQTAYAGWQIPELERREVVDLWGKLRWQLNLAGFLHRIKSLGEKVKGVWSS